MRFLPSPILLIIDRIFKQGDKRSVKARRDSLKMLRNKGLSIILSLCFLPLFLSCFDRVEYGIWVTILSLINWIGFFDMGLGQGLRNKLAESMALKNYRLAKEYVSTTYAVISLIFLSIICLFFLLYPFFDWYRIVNAPESLSREINIVILVVFVTTIITFILRLLVFVLYGLQKPGVVSDIGLLTHAVSLVSVFIAIKCFYISSLIVFSLIMTLIPIIIYLIYTIWLYVVKYPFLMPKLNYVRKKHFRALIGIGFFFFLIQLANIVMAQSNNLIISKVLGPEHVGEFQVAFQYMSVLTMIFYIVTTPYWSAVTDAYAKKDYSWIQKSVRDLNMIFLAVFTLAILMNVLSRFVFHIWIGDKIDVHYIVVFLMSLYILIQAYGNIYISIINGIGKIRLQFIVVLFSSIIYLPLALFMTRTYGLEGLLISMIIVAVIANLWAPVQYRYLIKGKAFGILNK